MVPQRSVELTLPSHCVAACFGRVHGLRGSLVYPDAVSAGTRDIKFLSPDSRLGPPAVSG